jgi:hypothetical protein
VTTGTAATEAGAISISAGAAQQNAGDITLRSGDSMPLSGARFLLLLGTATFPIVAALRLLLLQAKKVLAVRF